MSSSPLPDRGETLEKIANAQRMNQRGPQRMSTMNGNPHRTPTQAQNPYITKGGPKGQRKGGLQPISSSYTTPSAATGAPIAASSKDPPSSLPSEDRSIAVSPNRPHESISENLKGQQQLSYSEMMKGGPPGEANRELAVKRDVEPKSKPLRELTQRERQRLESLKNPKLMKGNKGKGKGQTGTIPGTIGGPQKTPNLNPAPKMAKINEYEEGIEFSSSDEEEPEVERQDDSSKVSNDSLSRSNNNSASTVTDQSKLREHKRLYQMHKDRVNGLNSAINNTIGAENSYKESYSYSYSGTWGTSPDDDIPRRTTTERELLKYLPEWSKDISLDSNLSSIKSNTHTLKKIPSPQRKLSNEISKEILKSVGQANQIMKGGSLSEGMKSTGKGAGKGGDCDVEKGKGEAKGGASTTAPSEEKAPGVCAAAKKKAPGTSVSPQKTPQRLDVKNSPSKPEKSGFYDNLRGKLNFNSSSQKSATLQFDRLLSPSKFLEETQKEDDNPNEENDSKCTKCSNNVPEAGMNGDQAKRKDSKTEYFHYGSHSVEGESSPDKSFEESFEKSFEHFGKASEKRKEIETILEEMKSKKPDHDRYSIAELSKRLQEKTTPSAMEGDKGKDSMKGKGTLGKGGTLEKGLDKGKDFGKGKDLEKAKGLEHATGMDYVKGEHTNEKGSIKDSIGRWGNVSFQLDQSKAPSSIPTKISSAFGDNPTFETGIVSSRTLATNPSKESSKNPSKEPSKDSVVKNQVINNLETGVPNTKNANMKRIKALAGFQKSASKENVSKENVSQAVNRVEDSPNMMVENTSFDKFFAGKFAEGKADVGKGDMINNAGNILVNRSEQASKESSQKQVRWSERLASTQNSVLSETTDQNVSTQTDLNMSQSFITPVRNDGRALWSQQNHQKGGGKKGKSGPNSATTSKPQSQNNGSKISRSASGPSANSGNSAPIVSKFWESAQSLKFFEPHHKTMIESAGKSISSSFHLFLCIFTNLRTPEGEIEKRRVMALRSFFTMASFLLTLYFVVDHIGFWYPLSTVTTDKRRTLTRSVICPYFEFNNKLYGAWVCEHIYQPHHFRFPFSSTSMTSENHTQKTSEQSATQKHKRIVTHHPISLDADDTDSTSDGVPDGEPTNGKAVATVKDEEMTGPKKPGPTKTKLLRRHDDEHEKPSLYKTFVGDKQSTKELLSSSHDAAISKESTTNSDGDSTEEGEGDKVNTFSDGNTNKKIGQVSPISTPMPISKTDIVPGSVAVPGGLSVTGTTVTDDATGDSNTVENGSSDSGDTDEDLDDVDNEELNAYSSDLKFTTKPRSVALHKLKESVFQSLTNLDSELAQLVTDNYKLALNVAHFSKERKKLEREIRGIIKDIHPGKNCLERKCRINLVHVLSDTLDVVDPDFKATGGETVESNSIENIVVNSGDVTTASSSSEEKPQSKETDFLSFASPPPPTMFNAKIADSLQKFLSKIPSEMIVSTELVICPERYQYSWQLPDRQKTSELFNGPRQFSLVIPFYGTGTVNIASQQMALTPGQVGLVDLSLPYQLIQNKGVVWLVVDLLVENVLKGLNFESVSGGELPMVGNDVVGSTGDSTSYSSSIAGGNAIYGNAIAGGRGNAPNLPDYSDSHINPLKLDRFLSHMTALQRAVTKGAVLMNGQTIDAKVQNEKIRMKVREAFDLYLSSYGSVSKYKALFSSQGANDEEQTQRITRTALEQEYKDSIAPITSEASVTEPLPLPRWPFDDLSATLSLSEQNAKAGNGKSNSQRNNNARGSVSTSLKIDTVFIVGGTTMGDTTSGDCNENNIDDCLLSKSIRASFFPLRLSLANHLILSRSLEAALSQAANILPFGMQSLRVGEDNGGNNTPYNVMSSIVLHPEYLLHMPDVWNEISRGLKKLMLNVLEAAQRLVAQGTNETPNTSLPDLIVVSALPPRTPPSSMSTMHGQQHGGITKGKDNRQNHSDNTNEHVKNVVATPLGLPTQAVLNRAGSFPFLISPKGADDLLKHLQLLNSFSGDLDSWFEHALGKGRMARIRIHGGIGKAWLEV